jgi:hypothetical protein
MQICNVIIRVSRVCTTELKKDWRECTRLFQYNGLKPRTWRILPFPISHKISNDQERSHVSDDDFPSLFL